MVYCCKGYVLSYCMLVVSTVTPTYGTEFFVMISFDFALSDDLHIIIKFLTALHEAAVLCANAIVFILWIR